MEDPERIALATPADAEAIMALYRSMIGLPGCTWNAWYPARDILDADIAAGNAFVLRGTDGILATIAIDHDGEIDSLPCWGGGPGEFRELARLCVRRELQGRGVARRMLAFGMDELRRRGYAGVRFLVSPHNPAALKSYAVFGFRNAGTVTLYEQDWYCYEKRFDKTRKEKDGTL